MGSHAELTEYKAQTDWSAWERWLKGHLDIELRSLHTALGQLLAEERAALERKTNDFAAKLARLSGAVDVLRGAQPQPPPKFPTVKAWKKDTVYHEGDIVACDGGCWQATRDTARAPGTKDWVCLAASGETVVGPSGSSLTIRGTYNGDAAYKYLDAVMKNGSSFVALKDNPGTCPGDDWHLLASCGSRGQRGIMGLRGERGQAAPTIQSWCIDRTRYTATPCMSDGTLGPTLELRALFEQFCLETQR